jgi:hypothetical protein
VDPGQSKLIKVLDRNPFPFLFIILQFTVKNMEGEFEVGEGLSESSDKLLDFDIQSQVFSDIIS